MMEESDTYLAILEEGEVKGAREVVLFVGEKRFGTADDSVKGDLSKIMDLARLKRMAFAAHSAHSWQEIIETP